MIGWSKYRLGLPNTTSHYGLVTSGNSHHFSHPSDSPFAQPERQANVCLYGCARGMWKSLGRSNEALAASILVIAPDNTWSISSCDGLLQTITHEHQGEPNRRQLTCLLSSLFRQQQQTHQSLRIPFTKDQWCGERCYGMTSPWRPWLLKWIYMLIPNILKNIIAQLSTRLL